MDSLAAAGLGLDLTPGLGVVPLIPPTMILCPTPHYAVTMAGGAPALAWEENKSSMGNGDGSWMLAKRSSIAELRLKAQQYAALFDVQ